MLEERGIEVRRSSVSRGLENWSDNREETPLQISPNAMLIIVIECRSQLPIQNLLNTLCLRTTYYGTRGKL